MHGDARLFVVVVICIMGPVDPRPLCMMSSMFIHHMCSVAGFRCCQRILEPIDVWSLQLKVAFIVVYVCGRGFVLSYYGYHKIVLGAPCSACRILYRFVASLTGHEVARVGVSMAYLAQKWDHLTQVVWFLSGVIGLLPTADCAEEWFIGGSNAGCTAAWSLDGLIGNGAWSIV